MNIESVDLFYLSIPQVRDIGDGSQDALLVRVRAGNHTGWGECEASPLVSVANYVCPMSHSACKPVRDIVLGRRIESPQDIVNLGHAVRAAGLDIAQTNHTLSGIEIACWDLLGKARQEPVYRLIGGGRSYPKTPYASQLFGDDPQQTLMKAKSASQAGYRAVKFGWGPFGRGTAEQDRDHIAAAREGVGQDVKLMIDAGTVWGDDVDKAARRLDTLEQFHALWLEEPFVGEAFGAYRALADHCRHVRLAGGEGADNAYAAQHLIEHGGIGYVQIDTGRIGGIAPARRVAEYARDKGVVFVNHTFTTHLALSASLAPFVDMEAFDLCEYPFEASSLARELYHDELALREGQVRLPEVPGLGVEPNMKALKRYLVDVRIEAKGRVLYATPKPD
ncbi:MAG: mandelate racemase/muconate lactonizing enzyme family protein [Phycisphaeraceae bacterium]|nr:mandelate racemase/muconate lactonizing enzyme family protein [Phycisphaeraceae bacterium]